MAASLVSNLLNCPSLSSTTTTTTTAYTTTTTAYTTNNNYHSRLLLLPYTLNLHSNPTLPKLTINSRHQETQPLATITDCCFPSLARAHIYYAKPFNFQLAVGEDEPEESLIRRFRRETRKSGVIYESRTKRRFFESSQDKRKRKAREAAHRRHLSKINWNLKSKKGKQKKKDGEEKGKRKKEEDSDDDNWELPEGELPY